MRISDGYKVAVKVSSRVKRQFDETLIKSPVDGELYPVSNLIRPIHREVVPIRWLIPGLIPLRELTVLVGDSDVGKSYMMMGLSSYITSGEFGDFFPRSDVSEPRNIFYFTREDDEDSTVLGRMQAHNFDPQRVIVMDKALTFSDFPNLEGAIVKYRPALVVWDTAAMFLSGKTEMNDQKTVVQDLEPLLGLARKYDFAVVVIAHLRKDSKGTLKDRIMASIGFQTLARAAVAVTWKDAECEEQKTTRIVGNIKGNLTKEVLAHEFAIDEQGKVQFQSSQASYGAMRKGIKDKAPSQQALCDDWMRAQLAAGTVLNSRLVEEAEAHGFSKSHLSRARSIHHASVKRLEDGLLYTVSLLDEALSNARSQVAGA